MTSGEIWHDVCVDCQPDMDIAICGTVIESNHLTEGDENSNVEEGQNCVVCMSMVCPTCIPESDDKSIVGMVGDDISSD